jgi:hypothetical protein
MARNALTATDARIPTLSDTIFEGTRSVRLIPDASSSFSLVAPQFLVQGTQPGPTTQATNAVDDTVTTTVPHNPDTPAVLLLASGRLTAKGERVAAHPFWRWIAAIGTSGVGLGVLGFVGHRFRSHLRASWRRRKDAHRMTAAPPTTPKQYGQPDAEDPTAL